MSKFKTNTDSHIWNKDRKKINRIEIIKFMFSFLKGGWKFIILSGLFSLIVSGLGLASIFVMQSLNQVINNQLTQQNISDANYNSRVDFLGGILILIYIATFIFNYSLSFGIAFTVERMSKRLTDFLYAKILRTQVAYYDKMAVGEFLSRINNDIDSAISQLPSMISQLFTSIFVLSTMLVAMIVISPYFFIIVIIIIPASFLGAFFIVFKSQKYYALRQNRLGVLSAFSEEAIAGQQEVNLFNQEKAFSEKFSQMNDDYARQQYKVEFWFSFIFPWNRFITQLLFIMVNIIGILFAYYRINTAGIYDSVIFQSTDVNNDTFNLLNYYGRYIVVINSFLLMMRTFQEPLFQITNSINVIQSFFSSSARLKELTQAQEEYNFDENINVRLVQNKDARKIIKPLNEVLTPANINTYQNYIKKKRDAFIKPFYYSYLNKADLHTDIEVKNLSFAYEKNINVLKNISFKVKRGQTVAIVGPTGSGKSTFINLLTKFYDLTEGDILFDGVSIKNITKPSMRENISIVLQDNIIFSDTVFNNIRFGHISATKEQVIEAAKIAEAHNFIMQLKDGYDTILKNNGENLSHGQKQLIGIARAVLSPSELLILDEATSSVDTTTEKEIQQAMINLLKNKTTFLIAHRLSTIKNADLIFVLKFGEIIESGSHDELIAQNGYYAQMYHSQSNFE